MTPNTEWLDDWLKGSMRTWRWTLRRYGISDAVKARSAKRSSAHGVRGWWYPPAVTYSGASPGPAATTEQLALRRVPCPAQYRVDAAAQTAVG